MSNLVKPSTALERLGEWRKQVNDHAWHLALETKVTAQQANDPASKLALETNAT